MILRITWLVVTTISLALFVMALPARHAQLQVVSPQANTRVGELLPQEAEALFDLGFSPQVYASYFTTLEILSAIPFLLVASALFWRKADDWVVFLISLTGVLTGTLAVPVVQALVSSQPVWGTPALLLRNAAVLGLIIQFFVFPDGRFIPSWTRWAAFLWVTYLLLATLIPAFAPPEGLTVLQPQDYPVVIWFFLWMGLGVYAQVYRYRSVSTATQRQQTKYVVWGLVVSFLVAYLTFSANSLQMMLNLSPVAVMQLKITFLTVTLLVGLPVLPISVALSILRYRLWDIDVIIRRTLVYTVLTTTLVVFYLGLVIVLESALRLLVGSSGQVATVISTLTIAALFTPLRRRVQDLIDRRFYRSNYNAEQALAGFAAAARDETDLEALTAQVVSIVQDTMQPEQVTLWLKESNR
ncbi:MAG: hypothetical protein JSV61_04870 [Anaerolineales bacterium]|nr:MAG: hypothetical protein JSV61_04870 [Anaerolineales bacterium]